MFKCIQTKLTSMSNNFPDTDVLIDALLIGAFTIGGFLAGYLAAFLIGPSIVPTGTLAFTILVNVSGLLGMSVGFWLLLFEVPVGNTRYLTETKDIE